MKSKPLFVLAMVTVLSMSVQAHQLPNKQPTEKPVMEMSKAEAWSFFQWVMGLMDVKLDANKHLSTWTKERISWMFKENQEDRIAFNVFASGRILDGQQVYGMASGYADGKANIEVDLSLLGIWFWDSYKQKTSVDRVRRNDLAVMLSHEVIHIQHGSAILQGIKSDLVLRKEEERRTWTASVLEDIRPLIRRGENLNEHFVQANEALRICNGDPDCPAFDKFIEGHTKK